MKSIFFFLELFPLSVYVYVLFFYTYSLSLYVHTHILNHLLKGILSQLAVAKPLTRICLVLWVEPEYQVNLYTRQVGCD